MFRHVQRLSFLDVVEALQRVTRSQESSRQVKQGLRKLKMTTSLSKLNPVLDGEGILRVGGRLENAAISYDAKHQIILPYRHHVTHFIIEKYYQEAGHLGQEYVLSSLRQLYWIIKGLCRKLENS